MSDTRFHVVWEAPPNIRVDDCFLSFLPPAEEEDFAQRVGHRVESGRYFAEQVRAQAFHTFVTICARIGTAPGPGGKTLRAALARPGECSDWWYHRVSSRVTCLTEPSTFELLVTALAIDRWASQRNARVLHLNGAHRLLVAVLRSKYRIVETRSWPPFRLRSLWWPAAALRERVVWLRLTWRTKRRAPSPVENDAGDPRPVVALTGHPWLRWNSSEGAFTDGMFKKLPAELEKRGMRLVRFLWYLGTRHGVDDLCAPDGAYRRGEAVALQAFLTGRDLIREMLSFRDLWVYWIWSRRPAFRAVFHTQGLDLFALFRIALLSGFVDSQIPLARLGAIATARACDACRPKASVCHFEWVADARPHYEGVRRSHYNTLATAIQHSSNTSALFYNIHPALEFRGEPDGCALPHAAHIFAMGGAGFERFRESGFEKEQLSLTGAVRFDLPGLRREVTLLRETRPRRQAGNPVRVLVLTSSLERDSEAIEAAYSAAHEIDGIEVAVRRKPGGYGTLRPSTAKLPIQYSDGSLAADLAASDLVLFSGSGAGEEALACGIPAWQWLAVNLEGTSLTEVTRLPQFHSVVDLREALTKFVRDPDLFEPSPESVAEAAGLFGVGDGSEAERIATRLHTFINEAAARTEVTA